MIMFDKHLDDHGVSYFDHQKLAFFFARESLKVSLLALIHGLFPNFFETTAGDTHRKILPRYREMLEEMKQKNTV